MALDGCPLHWRRLVTVYQQWVLPINLYQYNIPCRQTDFPPTQVLWRFRDIRDLCPDSCSLCSRRLLLWRHAWCPQYQGLQWTQQVGSFLRLFLTEPPESCFVNAEKCRVEITSYKGWTHPEWNSNTLANDIALVQLPTPAPINDYISPGVQLPNLYVLVLECKFIAIIYSSYFSVCLPVPGEVVRPGDTVKITKLQICSLF